jgi:hypothetical protein
LLKETILDLTIPEVNDNLLSDIVEEFGKEEPNKGK